MKKIQMARPIAMILALVVLLCTFTACSGPNLSGISGDELRTYIAMQSKNFKIKGSMFAYFFHEVGGAYVSSITQEELDERGYDDSKSLKEQYYDEDTTWYDYILEYVTKEVEMLLIMCEAATAEGITLNNDDYNYVNEQMTAQRTRVVIHFETDYNTYLTNQYNGYVNESDVIEIMLMETLAAKYEAHLHQRIEERMTQERLDAQIATMTGEKDETITRNLGHVLASYMQYDESQAYENCKTAKTRLLDAGKTEEAFEKIWSEFSDDANMIYENLSQGEMIAEIDQWLYAEERAVGDVGIVESENGCHLLFYISEGDPAYVAKAKVELEEIVAEELREELRKEYKIKTKKNVLYAIDI